MPASMLGFLLYICTTYSLVRKFYLVARIPIWYIYKLESIQKYTNWNLYRNISLNDCIVSLIFRRNATHCISPYVCVRACVRAYVRACVRSCVRACVRACVCVYMPRLWTSGKRFEMETFFFQLRGITSDIICKRHKSDYKFLRCEQNGGRKHYN